MRVDDVYSIIQNERFVLELEVVDQDGVPENMTGSTIDIDCSTSLPVTDFNTSTSLSVGSITVTANADKTATWPIGRHLMDVREIVSLTNRSVLCRVVIEVETNL